MSGSLNDSAAKNQKLSGTIPIGVGAHIREKSPIDFMIS
jgi:hypothetical protein